VTEKLQLATTVSWAFQERRGCTNGGMLWILYSNLRYQRVEKGKEGNIGGWDDI